MNPLLFGVVIISAAPILIHIFPFTADEAAFYRMALGATFFFVLTLFKKGPTLSKKERLIAIISGGAFAIDLMCWHRAIHYIGPGLATLIANMQVLMVGGVSMFLPGVKPKRTFWVAAVVSLMGLALLTGQNNHHHATKGIVLSLIAAVGYSAYLLTLKHIPQPDTAKTFQVMKWVSGSAMFFLSIMLLRQPTVAIPQTSSTLIMILTYGILLQGVAWSLIAFAMKKMKPFRVSLFLLLQPVLAIVWEVLFFSRVLNPTEMQGMALVFAGIIGSFLASSTYTVSLPSRFKRLHMRYTEKVKSF